jgi:O-antigen/teichoic acid export membrane protein
MVGRFSWALADQVLSSATNFALSFLVARTVGARDLGAFSVAYATFTFSLGAVRAIAGELVVVRHSAVPEAEWRTGVARASGTALLGGSLVAIACLVGGLAVGEPFRTALSILGLALPLLLIQDVWRFGFFARGRGRDAFLNDLVWGVLIVIAYALLRAVGVWSIGWLTFGWAAAGCAAAVVGMFQLRIVPSGPRAAVEWVRSHRDIAPRFFAEFVVGTGISSLMLFAVGAIAGLGELGRLRAGEIALGPLNVLFLGVGLVATAEGVHLLRESPKRLVLGCRWLSTVVMAGVLAWGALVLLVPHDIGVRVLRANWDSGRPLVPILVLALTGYGSGFGAWTGLRSLAAAKRSLQAKCVDGFLTLSCGLAGGYLAGAVGVAWSYAVSGWLKSLNAWWQFSRALNEHAVRDEGDRTTMATVSVRRELSVAGGLKKSDQ